MTTITTMRTTAMFTARIATITMILCVTRSRMSVAMILAPAAA
jgi:hypothetical protein